MKIFRVVILGYILILLVLVGISLGTFPDKESVLLDCEGDVAKLAQMGDASIETYQKTYFSFFYPSDYYLKSYVSDMRDAASDQGVYESCNRFNRSIDSLSSEYFLEAYPLLSILMFSCLIIFQNYRFLPAIIFVILLPVFTPLLIEVVYRQGDPIITILCIPIMLYALIKCIAVVRENRRNSKSSQRIVAVGFMKLLSWAYWIVLAIKSNMNKIRFAILGYILILLVLVGISLGTFPDKESVLLDCDADVAKLVQMEKASVEIQEKLNNKNNFFMTNQLFGYFKAHSYPSIYYATKDQNEPRPAVDIREICHRFNKSVDSDCSRYFLNAYSLLLILLFSLLIIFQNYRSFSAVILLILLPVFIPFLIEVVWKRGEPIVTIFSIPIMLYGLIKCFAPLKKNWGKLKDSTKFIILGFVILLLSGLLTAVAIAANAGLIVIFVGPMISGVIVLFKGIKLKFQEIGKKSDL